ncbi:MAG: polyprenyl synthetase family protein [Bacillota bacterium]
MEAAAGTGAALALPRTASCVPFRGARWAFLARDMEGVRDWIRVTLETPGGLLGEAGRHLLRGTGKHLRPGLVLLCARLGDYRPEHVIPVAAAVEMVHMATLVHDDVIDGSPQRRGWPTVNVSWNERVAVLLGDYLFSRALTLGSRYGGQQVVDLLAGAVEEMCKGEMDQEAHRFDPDQTEEQYLARIGRKTARFIADCCRTGALLAGAPAPSVEALGDYGYSLGLAFQIMDDVLDFTGSRAEMGKPPGSDLGEGVLTLPVILALHGDRAPWIREVISRRQLGEEELHRLRNILQEDGYLERARDLARSLKEEALQALSCLPPGRVAALLGEAAQFVVERRF